MVTWKISQVPDLREDPGVLWTASIVGLETALPPERPEQYRARAGLNRQM
jgi:hypothetical protein